MNARLQETIQDALQECRERSLAMFVDEFMEILSQQGYSLEEFLWAMASWAYSQSNSNETVYYIERASLTISEKPGIED
jgi:hypothetical protein